MAFAAVISLDYTMERHTGRWDWKSSAIEPQIKEFALMLDSLTEVLERLDSDRNRSIDRIVMNELDAKITEAAWKLEDVLEFYMLNQSLPRRDEIPLVDKNVVEQEMNLFLKRAKVLRDEYTRELDKPLPAAPAGEEEEDDAVVAMEDFVGKKSTMIGLWDQFEEIRNELLDPQSETKIVPLVGMAGIGKSHLARQIYQHPTILQHFDLLVWVRLGVKHQAENTFLDIVAQIEHKPRNAYRGKDMVDLASYLEKILCGRKCLIVLDDVWSIYVCDYLNWFLKDGDQKRFLVTTRLEEAVLSNKRSFNKTTRCFARATSETESRRETVERNRIKHKYWEETVGSAAVIQESMPLQLQTSSLLLVISHLPNSQMWQNIHFLAYGLLI